MPIILTPGQVDFQLAYEVSPITLVGGNLSYLPGGALPIVALTQPGIYGFGLPAAALSDLTLDEFFATFKPLPGATLIDNDIGEYPFANQQVAGNAIIFNPLRVSMLMICPARLGIGYFTRTAIIGNLKSTLDAFNVSGGLYNVATPAYTWTNMVLRKMEDVSPEVNAESPQPQIEWRMDFEAPLVTQAQAAQAQSNLMSKITSQSYLGPDATWSGTATSAGSSTAATGAAAIPTSRPTPSGLVSGISSPPSDLSGV